MGSPSGRVPEQAPRWDLVDTESCGGGIRFLAPPLIDSGYVDIYRRKKYVGGASRGPQGRGRALGGRAPYPRDHLVAFLTYFFLLYISTYPQTIGDGAKNLIPPPKLFVSTRSHLGACFGAPREGIDHGGLLHHHPSPSDEV